MNTKQMILQELDSISEDMLIEVLSFLRLLKINQDKADIEPETSEYPLIKFYGCIQDDTFFRHPQGKQPEREAIV
jgi:hypothetical protein